MKPEVPQQKPEVPQNKPETPQVKPDTPQVKPEQPQTKPEVPQVKPEIPQAKPETPQVKPEVPQQKPEVPQNKPEVPQQKPDIPQSKPEVPQTKPEQPQTKPEVPQDKPIHPNMQNKLPGFKPDVGLQEYLRYEMLKPENHHGIKPPSQHPIHDAEHNNGIRPDILANIHHPHEKHPIPEHGHHHKHMPPPEKPIESETLAAANVMQNIQQPTEPTITQMRQRLSGDAAELFFTGLINLNDLSETLKTNSKSAKAKLILAMANASKQGIDNSQINDTLKMISAGMAATESSTPSKILKNIIELYLPWYPLQQGVGFDLSIETKPGEQDFLSVLKVWIQTRNYGNVNSVLTLLTANSVDMNIQCNDNFPKDDLLKRLNEETFNHTMQSSISIEATEQTEGYIEPQQQAKVNLSSTYEMNPYLLLMAHSFIKNTIIIDSSLTIG